MRCSPDERNKKEHMETYLIYFHTHGCLSQSEEIMYLNIEYKMVPHDIFRATTFFK